MAAYTDEEYAIAKSGDLVRLAEEVGYATKRSGAHHILKEMDSVVIFDRQSWYRYSECVGGSQIDFLMYFKDMEFKEAMNYLLEREGYRRDDRMDEERKQEFMQRKRSSAKKKPEKKEFILPQRSSTNRCMYAYLIKQRKLSKQVVDYFVQKNLLYESSPHHNIVFLGRDQRGATRFANQRGTKDNLGKPFKRDVSGSDKTYGINIVNSDSKELHAFEAAIDMMSYIDNQQDYRSSKLALGMVSDGPLEKMLSDCPHIKSITFCLDDDKAGRKAMFKLIRKYAMREYEVNYELPPFGKDHNEFLVLKSNLQELRKQLDSVKQTSFGKSIGENEPGFAASQKKVVFYRSVKQEAKKEIIAEGGNKRWNTNNLRTR